MLKKLTSKNRQKGKKNTERGERERETEGGKEGKECERERGRRRELSAFECKMFFSRFNWKQTHSDYFHTNIQES